MPTSAVITTGSAHLCCDYKKAVPTSDVVTTGSAHLKESDCVEQRCFHLSAFSSPLRRSLGCRENGVSLAQKTQVSPRRPVGVQRHASWPNVWADVAFCHLLEKEADLGGELAGPLRGTESVERGQLSGVS